MRVKLFFIASLIWACAFAQAQSISWRSDRPLSVSDFKGRPDRFSPFFALTYSEINQSYQSDEKGMRIEISHMFISERSWMKKDGADSALLAHEQRHFDISEIYSRRIQKELKKMKFSDRFALEFKNIVEQHIKQMDHAHDFYDKQTRHGTNKEAQATWDRKIAGELAELSEPLAPFYLPMD